MDILKRLFRGFCSLLFKFCIIVVAFSAAVVTVFGTPGNLKDSLKDSGIYSSVADGIIDQAKKEQTDNQQGGESDVPIDDPDIQAAIKNALPPEYLEQISGSAIDGVFGWLQGKAKTPQFTIDLNEAKQKLAVGVADVAYQRAVTLPPCTVQQLQTINPNDLDIFNLPCLPPGINLQAERSKIQNQIANSGDVLKDTTVSADDLPKENGQNMFEQAETVPTVYQWPVRLPWILAGLAVLSGVGVYFLHDERRRALLVLVRATLVVGIVLLVGVLLTNFLIGQLRPQSTEALQTTAVDLARDLVSQLNAVINRFGIVYVLLGGGGLLALHFTKPKTLEQAVNSKTPAETPSELVENKTAK